MSRLSRARAILSDVHLTIEPGEALGVVGDSGCGKSMLALSIMGLLPRAVQLTQGRVLLDGDDLVAGGAAAWRRRRGRDLAMIFQEPMTALNPVMRVGRQVEEVLVKRRGMLAADARREALALFRRVEIPRAQAMLDSYPHEMSGGMRQRVMIAMALAARARLLIADEPTTALDVTIQAQILALLRSLQRESGLSILFITHDLGVIAEIANRVLVLYGGRVAEIDDGACDFRQCSASVHPCAPVCRAQSDGPARTTRIGRRLGTFGWCDASGLSLRATMPSDTGGVRQRAATLAHH